MTRKREPVAVIGDDYLIVKHTHDIDLARRLMTVALADENGCPSWVTWPRVHTCTDECIDVALKHWADRLASAKPIYARVTYALDSSFAAAEGWGYAFHEQDHRSRGAFPAVVFR